jgi:hypothetical protein
MRTFFHPHPLLGDYVATVPDSIWSVQNRQTLAEFSTAFPEEISIGNFIWELREIASLLPQISHSYVRMIQDGVLNLEFGWKPFLRDLETLAGLTNSVAERLKYLKATKGKVTRLGRYVPDVYDVPIQTIPNDNPVRGYAVSAKHLGTRFDYRAGGRLFHNLDYLDGVIGKLRAFSGALGLNNPIKAIWNALPFSFVVDWFLDVSGHLNALNAQPVGWEVEYVSCSILQTAAFDMWQLNEDLFGGGGFPPRKLGTVYYRRYIRWPGLPIANLEISSLSPKELVLLTALLK